MATNCGCPPSLCTPSVLDQVATDNAGTFTCRDRITWVMENAGQTEKEACVTVSNEFPTICGQGCNPNSCNSDAEEEEESSSSSDEPSEPSSSSEAPEEEFVPPPPDSSTTPHLRKSSDRVKHLLSTMSLEDKIGQMSQIELALVLEDGPDGKKKVNSEKLEHYFGKLGIGSLLNNIVGEHTSAQRYREIMIQIQAIAKKYNRPPVIWGLDSIHGANYVHGAIMSPQPLNLAATFNTTTALRAGQVASRDTRAAGISWLFSPLLGIALEPNWSRVYETFGEDPKLVGDFAAAMIKGIQLPAKGVPSRAAACAKHFVGYSKPLNGHDRAPSWIPTRHLYQYFVPPWRKVLGPSSPDKAMTVMESYTETDGVPNVGNKQFLRKLLRQQLGFDGVLVTDYSEILNLHSWHHVASSDTKATIQAIAEGSVDMSMIPFDADGFRSAIQEGIKKKTLTTPRLDESVARVLDLKEQLGMIDETLIMDDVNLGKVGEGREDALDMAHQGIVLVQNHNETLPINSDQDIKIHITGPTSQSLRYQSGGWTGQWQGAPSDDEWFTYGTTVVEALGNTSTTWHVTVSCGVDTLGEECSDDDNKNGWSEKSGIVDTIEDWIGIGGNDDDNSIQRAAEQASHADYVVVCVGEENYTEKPGDIRSLALPNGQYELVRALQGKAKHIILVYFGGRPRLLHDMVDIADAVLIGFLPGPDAGRAVADLVAGKENPSGRLPITYPKFEDGAGAPYFSAVSDQCTSGEGTLPHYNYVPCEVQWPLGHGLGYTTFEYSDFAVSPKKLNYRARGQQGRNDSNEKSDDLTVSVNVKNSGTLAGAEVVMFFSFDESRQVTPEYKRLRAFEKIALRAGETKTVTASINVNELRFVGAHDDSHFILQHGLRFRVGVGAHTDCRGSDTESDLCSSLVTIDTGGDHGGGACDAACKVWADSGCADELNFSPFLCWRMCTNNNEFSLGGEKDNDGWGWNYVNCIEAVVGAQEGGSMQNHCWKMTALCRNVLSNDMITAPEFGPTNPTASIFVALIAGIIGSTAVVLAFMRRTSPKRSGWRNDDGNVEFSVVSNRDDVDDHAFT